MTEPFSLSATPKHDEGPSRRTKVADARPARALRPATAEVCDHEGLRSSARSKAGAGTPIVNQLTSGWLPRRAFRGWLFAELLRLPRIVRQRASEGVVPLPRTRRVRRASAKRLGRGTVLASSTVRADS